MPKIVIQNLFDREIFTSGDRPNLLRIIHENQIDWMHACGAKGRCTTCKAVVLMGIEGMGELTDVEKKYREAGRLKPNERLACQSVVEGDLVISVADENKFQHMQYSH